MARTIPFPPMPTYVYKFLDTGETLEVQQSFSDDTLTEAVHPGTGATMAVKKVFQPVGVTFKGDGFYKTDSRSSSKAGAGSKSETSGTESGSGDTSTKADTAGGETKKTPETTSTTSSTESTPSPSQTKPTGGSTTTKPGTTSGTKPGKSSGRG
jgi:predicted nucleic acid-binding Zn ribbon protein